MTETNGTVSGTLLVTPGAMMFDPDLTHPLVVENGQDLYIMMAKYVFPLLLLRAKWISHQRVFRIPQSVSRKRIYCNVV